MTNTQNLATNFVREDIDFLYRMGRKGTKNRPIKIGMIGIY